MGPPLLRYRRSVAKVFISYRRADGQYAVGWLAQRLAMLATDPTVEVAFRDGDLLAGDDFHAALAEKVSECAILIAVIGPNWLGEREGQPNRILDPTDWVGQEITSALDEGTIIVPVLIDGALPVTAADLAPEHAALAKRNAKRFETEEDLDKILIDITKQLARVDEEQARVAGLDRPIKLDPPMSIALAVGLATLGVVVGGVLGWYLTGTVSDRPSTFWSVATSIQLSLCGAFSLVGVNYVLSRFSSRVRIRSRPVALTMLSIVGVILWGATQYGGLFNNNDAVTVIVAGLTLLLAGPWVVAAIGSAWTEFDISMSHTRERALAIAMLSRVGLVASSVLAVIAASAVVTSTAALDRVAISTGEARSTLVTYGALLSVMIGAVLVYSRTRLERESLALMESIADLAKNYRELVQQELVDEPIGRDVRWIIVPVALPLAVGVIMAFVYSSL